jgi:hypothetical protein
MKTAQTTKPTASDETPCSVSYIPFGPEWKSHCGKLPKRDLIDLHEKICRENIATKEHLESLVLRLRKAEAEWREIGRMFKAKYEDGFDHRGEIFLECSERLREMISQNA